MIKNRTRVIGHETDRRTRGRVQMYSEIIIIGPMGVGKSTIAGILSRRLRKERICLDQIKWYYYFRQGYSRFREEELDKEIGFRDGVYKYWKPFEADAVVNVVKDFSDCIFDMGAGHSVYEDDELFRQVEQALKPYKNVILLMPSTDRNESLDYLVKRINLKDNDLIEVQKHFIENHSNWDLAKHIVYVKDRSPEDICDEIMTATGYIQKD